MDSCFRPASNPFRAEGLGLRVYYEASYFARSFGIQGLV